jgi:hypothetical protein
MAQVKITDLPNALPLTGFESVPIVQNGVTVQTTTGSISVQPSQLQTFLTATQQPSLPNSRYLTAGTGLDIVDNGAGAALQINLTGSVPSLNSIGNGLVVKTATDTLAARQITVGTGLGITNGDGVAGNPLVALGSFLSDFVSFSGASGIVGLNGGVFSALSVLGTAGQVAVANGSGAGGNPTVSLVGTGVTPGTYSSANITVDTYGRITSATSGAGSYVTSFSAGTTGLTPSTATTGAVTMDGILNVNHGGTGSTSLTGYVKGSGTSAMTASSTIPTTDLSGTISNAQLANSAITINGSSVSLGGSISVTSILANPLTIGTGLTGTSFDGSAPVTIAIDSTVVTLTGIQTLTNKSISGSANTLTNIGNSSLVNSAITINGTPVSLGGSISISTGISTINGTTDQIDVVTVGGIATISIADAPLLTGPVKVLGTGSTSITPFANTMQVWEANTNNYELVYARNINNGSDASVDFVAYNDASDVDSYFVDMGITSSNYTNPIFTIFPANGGYVYTGGGTSGQASALLLGTSNAASDIVLFTGGTLLANTRATIKGNTGNVLIGTSTDTGYQLNVAGTTLFSGASEFGSTVLLSANPTLALEAATKQYVDNQVTAGLHIHEPVRVETTGNLTATYAQGGTTFDITAITGGNTVTTSTTHGLSVNDQIWLYTSAGNGLSVNIAYFVFSVPASNQLTLSLTFGGSQITGLTNAAGLTYATRANSGIGSTLTNSGAQAALIVDGVSLSVADRVMVRLQTNGAENGVYTVTTVGSGSTNWVLTRATDSNQVNPADPNGVGTGDYYFTREGLLNAGDSHVLTTEPNTMIIGYTTLTFTQFSGSVDYVGGTNITVVGQTINVSGTIAATLGGTGTSTVTTGDLLYGSATNTWSKLPLGSAYKSLIVNASGTQVEWNAIPLNQSSAVSGQLSVSNGGTGASTLTGYVQGNGTSAFTASATIPTTDLSGTITNAQLANSSITINGSAISLGGTVSVGTVTSVAATAGTGISISGSPITSSGTLTITNTAPDQTVAIASGTGISVTGTYPNFTVTNTSPSSGGTVTSVTGSSPVVSSGGTTPDISLASGYGDTQNPYASKTANYVLAAPNGSSGAPTFRALVAADIPSLSYVTSVSGTAGQITSTGGTTPVLDLTSGIVTAGTTGSSSLIPVITVDTYGRVTSITTAANPQGTVTSVDVSGGTTGLTTSGGPVTASGTITLAGTLNIANGGTGQTSASAAFNALSPITTTGDLILGNGTNSATRLAIGANAYVLTSDGTTASWQPAGGGSMVYPAAGIAVSTGSAWTTSLTAPSGAIVGTTDTQTLTNKTVVQRVVSIADATSITVDADTTDVATQANTQAAGTLTVNAPTGTPVNGQKFILRLSSTSVQTFSWNAIFAGSTDLALPTSSTGSGKYDYVGFIYNSTATKWQLLAKVFGF